MKILLIMAPAYAPKVKIFLGDIKLNSEQNC